MYTCNVRHFTYGNIPGSGKGWTLDVCAVSRHDANEYIKKNHRGGKFIGENIKATCGATTKAAQERLRDALERWLKPEKCNSCDGSGYIDGSLCDACGGRGCYYE